METLTELKKTAQKTIELHLVLCKDAGDWHYAYGLIEMALTLGLLTDDQAHRYRAAADQARKKAANG